MEVLYAFGNLGINLSQLSDPKADWDRPICLYRIKIVHKDAYIKLFLFSLFEQVEKIR